MNAAAPALAGLVRELETVVESSPPDNLPEVLGVLERARARAFERLMRTPAAPVEDPLLTMQDVAKRLLISKERAYELARRGELPTVRFGERCVRLRQSRLEEWIRRREAGGKVSTSRGPRGSR